jgi:hypothetical protein
MNPARIDKNALKLKFYVPSTVEKEQEEGRCNHHARP